MAITKRKVFDKIEILETGIVQLRSVEIFEENGKEVARSKPHREVRNPDNKFDDLPDRVQNIMKANFDHAETKQRWNKAKQKRNDT